MTTANAAMKVLFAASEAYPLIKTGGLADVAGYLPLALQRQGVEVTLALPAYHDVFSRMRGRIIAHIPTFQGYALVRERKLRPGGPTLWLIDHPLFSLRPGNPYNSEHGDPWPDNATRFGLFAQTLARMVERRAENGAPFDVIHCHDWQTGLLPAYLQLQNNPPPTIFTIHNLAYQGVFPADTLEMLELPPSFFSVHGLEFYGQISFLKGGLYYATKITTVSPNYAQEIKTEAFAHGLAGLLNDRTVDLTGIINGIDTEVWNPATDKLLPARYDAGSLERKAINKQALQARMGLAENRDLFLLGNIGRLAEQKGIDLLTEVVPELMMLPVQVAVLGSGEWQYERTLRDAQEHWPGRFACFIGYDENLAHLIEAGSDAFLMPSRFEPCGLNQMYSQAYGTPPIVSPTGGLRDTVVDTDQVSLQTGTATGFFMSTVSSGALLEAVRRAKVYYEDKPVWNAIQRNGMEMDFSWEQSAREYIQLYRGVAAS